MTTYDAGWRQMVAESQPKATKAFAKRDDYYGFERAGFDWFDNARRSGWMLRIPNGRIDKVYVVDPNNDFALFRVINGTAWLELDKPRFDQTMTPDKIRETLEAAR